MTTELGQLLRCALSRMEDDSDLLLRIALKACVSANVPVRDVLWSAFQLLEIPNRYTLRVWFKALARLGQLEELVVLLTYKSTDTRIAVIHAFYHFGGRTHVGILEGLLSDPDAEVRRRAQEAIARILEPSHVPWHSQDIGGPLSDTERVIARLMLGQVDGVSDAATIVRIMSGEGRAIRQLAREALQYRAPLVGDILVAALDDVLSSDEGLTTEAIHALQDLGDDRAVRLLIRALAIQPAPTRHVVVDALTALGAKVGAHLLDAFETNPIIRARDGRLLARTAGTAALQVLLTALSSPLRAERRSAVEGLVALGAPSVPPLLILLQRSSGDEAADVLNILGQLGPPDALEAIVQQSDARDASLRAAAIRALARFESAGAHEVVARAIGSDNWEVREAAMELIRHWDWHNHEAVGWLSDAIHDPHPRVRNAAAHSLRHLSSQSRDLGAHVTDLLQTFEQEDEPARARAELEIRHLRGMLAFYFMAPRLFSPEGGRQFRAFETRIQQIADLHPYSPWRALYMPRVFGAGAVDATSEVTMAPDKFSTSEIPRPITDDVRFSVTCPFTVVRQQPCVLDVWVHPPEAYEDVLEYVRRDPRMRSGVSVRSKGPVPVARGTALVVKLRVPDLCWEDEDSVYWSGTIGNATFSFTVPKDAPEGDHAGHVHIYATGMQIARLSFLITVAGIQGNVHDMTSRQHRVTSAFASYATEDRNEVLARIQGMLSVVPDLDIFLDVMSLRSGEQWQERLESEIVNRDVLYLFWSTAARESAWVEREWRTALRTKGLEGIDPIPLETPDKAPPPQELASLHFNEWTLQVRR